LDKVVPMNVNQSIAMNACDVRVSLCLKIGLKIYVRRTAWEDVLSCLEAPLLVPLGSFVLFLAYSMFQLASP
jgi:hypothetical protein